MTRRHKKGQSTLEYVLLITAVIVIIIGLVASSNSPFRNTLNTMLGDAVKDMGTKGNGLIHKTEELPSGVGGTT